MKKLVLSALLAVSLLAPATAAMADTKIATINMHEVFQNLPQREAAMKKLQNEFAGRIKELQGLESQMKALYQKQQKNKGLMSDDEQTQLQRKLAELQSQFQLKRKNYQDDRREAGEKEQRKLIGKIQSAVAKIAKSKHLDLVIPVDATAFSKPDMDISKAVIDAVSKQN
ncbi:OmpH family outer membrane protein [Celerinatantimonas sp. MCCC 1A17872]|uniref:OmpH family outer membrane protein n=1 Tax=Celerinatantimonas sp. MCCC 1A17872 TaxID=3177514 RepID=UPI0038BFA2E0